MLVSFDFDDTLLLTKFDEDLGSVEAGPNEPMLAKLRDHVCKGDDVIIVTTRKEHDAERVHQFVEEHDLPVREFHFTNGDDKAEMLVDLDVGMHHDDDPFELDLLPSTIQGVQAPIHESWDSF